MNKKTIGISLIIASCCAGMTIGPLNATTPTLEGTDWQLKSWTGTNLVKDTKITISFQKDRMAGSAGCNRFMGSYTTKDGASFSVKPDIATTMMACPEDRMKQETKFLTALKGVREYAINPAGELQFIYRLPDGLGMMTFSRQRQNRPAPRG